jgi:feruloyl esterase
LTTFNSGGFFVSLSQAADMPIASVDRNTSSAMECANLANEDLSQFQDSPASILSSRLVSATNDTGEYCAVSGYVQPQVQFELRLPTKTWNGRYLQSGCGGFCGRVNINGANDALEMGFAVAAQNMGHVGGGDELWGSVPQLRVDFGRRSTHVVALASKEIIARFYGQQPARAYFRGCSTGGREGLSEAIQFPGDFDGIVAGDPAFPGRQGGIANNWIAHQLNTPDGKLVFPEAKLDFLHAEAVKSCDAIDGVEDGIITDPRNCKFDPASLRCAARSDGPDCLNDMQVAAAQRLYDGPRNSSGRRLYPGYVTVGSEQSWKRSADSNFANNYLRFLAFPENPPLSYTFWNFDFDKDFAKLEQMAALYDPVAPNEDPDLSGFRERGGKLIVYHGWADLSVSPLTTVDLYAEVAQREGGIDKLKNWYRVFMISSMPHCRGGGVPDRFDMLGAVMDWVEQGKAPDRILASQMDGNAVVRTRPLYPYPTVAKYKGTGDVNDAANWEASPPPVVHDDDLKWVWDPQ